MHREPSELPARPPLRSLLFVPATMPRWIDSAIASGADAVIVDLEDAVPAAKKGTARVTAARIAAGWREPAALFVRINDLSRPGALADLRAVVQPALTAVVVPKISSVADIAVADRMLSWCEIERGMPAGSVALVPLLETASALRDAFAIASAAPRIAYLGALTVPGGDIELALGGRWTPGGAETLAVRSQVLLDARAAGIVNPVSGLWTDVTDLDGLRRFADQTRDIGYEGMMAIHPTHVPVINDVFGLTQAQADHYRRVIAAVEQASAAGLGTATVDGRMVDEAMAVTARQRLGWSR